MESLGQEAGFLFFFLLKISVFESGRSLGGLGQGSLGLAWHCQNHCFSFSFQTFWVLTFDFTKQIEGLGPKMLENTMKNEDLGSSRPPSLGKGSFGGA